MPLGILEDHKLEHVPGTSPLNELGRVDIEVTSTVDPNLLKRDPTGQMILVPQPSDSPNDPYNWPTWKKEMFTVSVAFGCGAVGGRPRIFATLSSHLTLIITSTPNSGRPSSDIGICAPGR